ncbi:MAG: hypothetical protein II756_00630, partial [Clostridia bacterium]|nr:hypothetical protein [Clostridia bacterium]
KRATELAKRMVTEFGMSDVLGPVFLAGDEEVFIGREWGHQPNYSEAVAADIDREIRRILEEAADRAKHIIEENADAMTRIIAALVEHEHLSGAEFERLLNGEENWQDPDSAKAAPAADAPGNDVPETSADGTVFGDPYAHVPGAGDDPGAFGADAEDD